ncbi:lysophospholipid acyltransferase family protein [Aeoliella mucimassa]|uniref:DUF374 domain-containing protein n=1 Tax=Aeoliella mucimassa TaxID=2527972 RepID=A0A518AKG1_9BACT|nr:lysophospholipid acyltransferase family protein [Aeoliella mucimassa]QDU55221.1 hypothetical protein Pan181_14070 [Aeoliella mucimassa]
MRTFGTGLLGFLTTRAIHAWMGTLDYRVLYYDRSLDPIRASQPGIYIFWHENILFPLHLRGHSNLSMLLSRHRDADILAVVARLSGFGTVRGSTGRGGQDALKQLMRLSGGQHLTITPDGPRGPRRKMADGPIYLASRTGLPLIAMGFGYDRPWRFNSWDRFAVPKPFSRARAIVGPPILIPAGIDREQTKQYREAVESFMTELTEEATLWAESGVRREGEEAAFCQPTWPLEPTVVNEPTIPMLVERRAA